MFERMRQMEKLDADPNLIPVMNLFVAMIPFLLLAVAFFQLGVIPTTLPTHTESSDVEANTKAVTVSLVVNDGTVDSDEASEPFCVSSPSFDELAESDPDEFTLLLSFSSR